MVKIEVLGSGCAKCNKVEQIIKEYVTSNDVPAEVTHVTNITEIAKRGVLMTPAVSVDGKIVLEGKVPKTKDIEKWL